ncbi:MAG: threonyl-tRNA synthetase [Microgenomates group bacterium Gr01-1014_16]|nr:MAG: threonyl-tRNA synthetase [Microgenomates group bacterium Gr01-1014_16]
MSISTHLIQKNNPNLDFYIFDDSNNIPIRKYEFKNDQQNLQTCLVDEFYPEKSLRKIKNNKFNQFIEAMGFQWDTLTEPGHMRLTPYANAIMEAIEKYSWLQVTKNAKEVNVPTSKIGGGELYDPNSLDIKNVLRDLFSGNTAYGSNYYNVKINNTVEFLRYSACTQKLSFVKTLSLDYKNLPFGLFEISKSYRFEEEKELQLCNRVRSFHLPELHIITDKVSSSLKIGLKIHQRMVAQINSLGMDFEILCNVTDSFFKKNQAFLSSFASLLEKPFLLTVTKDNASGKDGVELDVEYKVFDCNGTPIEISTFQVDDGSSPSAFGISYKSDENTEKLVSTMHIVFNASVERFAYVLLNNAFINKSKLPFWASPIQIRVIPFDKNSLHEATKLTEEMDSMNIRSELDDRDISYTTKNADEELAWIPYAITVKINNNQLQFVMIYCSKGEIIEKIIKKDDLMRELRTKLNGEINIPRYFPINLSSKIEFK